MAKSPGYKRRQRAMLAISPKERQALVKKAQKEELKRVQGIIARKSQLEKDVKALETKANVYEGKLERAKAKLQDHEKETAEIASAISAARKTLTDLTREQEREEEALRELSRQTTEARKTLKDTITLREAELDKVERDLAQVKEDVASEQAKLQPLKDEQEALTKYINDNRETVRVTEKEKEQKLKDAQEVDNAILESKKELADLKKGVSFMSDQSETVRVEIEQLKRKQEHLDKHLKKENEEEIAKLNKKLAEEREFSGELNLREKGVDEKKVQLERLKSSILKFVSTLLAEEELSDEAKKELSRFQDKV